MADVKKWTKKKIITEIIEWFLIVVLLGIVAFIVVFAAKKPTDKSPSSLFGYETRLVLTGSMDQEDESFYDGKDWKIKRIKTGSLVFIDSAPGDMTKLEQFANEINIGDVITFVPVYGSLNTPVTHRVIGKSVESTNSKLTFITQGDANDAVDEPVPFNNLVGKVIGSSYFLGKLYQNYFSNKYAVAATIVVPCLVVIIYEGFKIAKIVKEDKSKKLKVENSILSEDDRIEQLKKELEELEQRKKNSNDSDKH